MTARKVDRGESSPDRGNFISEWFGHRLYPAVVRTEDSFSDMKLGRCPFLSSVIGQDKTCVKPATSNGVCTISSRSNGPRQDWLVCPYRALDGVLFEDVARRLFRIDGRNRMSVLPAPRLESAGEQQKFLDFVKAGNTGIVYLEDKLGGEISISATQRSPELAFDITFVELRAGSDGLRLGQFGILEIQTMDFHGSYRNVVANLRDALRLHGDELPRVLKDNQNWLSERIEGPNIANVFKRTFYQMVMKFQIGSHETCAGCVLAIPQSVWDSWQRHLGAPELRHESHNIFSLKRPANLSSSEHVPAWIYVFDLDASSLHSPSPLEIKKIIATDAESVVHYALRVAPEAALTEGGSASQLIARIRRRLAVWLPDIHESD